MKRNLPLLSLLLLISGALYVAASLWQNGLPASYWEWRRELVMLSGVLLMTVMSAAMLLAARPRRLEPLLGGLDRLYALHKRLGIAAGLLLATHWLIKLSPKLMLAMAWVAPRVKSGGGKNPLTSLAKDVGEWAAWAVLAMVILALLRAVPYRFWRKLHKLFGPLYLMGVFHGLILMPTEMWAQPVGWLLAALMLTGSGCALYSLAGRIGKQRQYAGRVQSVEALPAGQLEVICQMDGWPGHRAGQFALVRFSAAEGAHPFTIASADHDDGRLRFIIKALGDYTRRLPDELEIGQAVTVEGPYGCFQPRVGARQAWVAGGIGVTPFLAWLQSRELAEGQQDVDFYYCVRSRGDAARLEEVRQACRQRGVRLHLIESEAGALLSADMLPEVDEVWFCGPQGLGAALQRGLRQRGAQAPVFHHEAFAMR
ncbi:ferric reductase-like transmembrane domain-containing protein [Chromobacterium alkanivorans]|uniref:ferredoxin reductase family protein n=1 Tax=Chromobacterium alkanivorans TaxID=1071719 RepID=UPI001968234D|nr:ferric reductase-like transmembrane domain-containing protein [Chromobacterium alkanivorans]MBN3002798.1 ferric reductase-like transmembrane domain-containing protein [Chromobacterium alkanivorans]